VKCVRARCVGFAILIAAPASLTSAVSEGSHFESKIFSTVHYGKHWSRLMTQQKLRNRDDI